MYIYSLVTRLYIIQDSVSCIVYTYCTSCTLGRAPVQKSKSRNRVSARAKLEVSKVFYVFFILKQKNVKYGVFYYFSAVSFNYAL